jgi:hypothetical protein
MSEKERAELEKLALEAMRRRPGTISADYVYAALRVLLDGAR